MASTSPPDKICGPSMTVMYRRSRFSVPLGPTLSDVLAAIDDEIGVDPNEMVIIVRGRKVSLQDRSVDPASVGLVDGVVALVMKGRPSLPTSPTTAAPASSATSKSHRPTLAVPNPVRTLRDAEKELSSVRADLQNTDAAVSRHTKGFSDAHVTSEALRRDDNACRGLDERLMRLLERVDGLDAPSVPDLSKPASDAVRQRDQWRAERKALVANIQTMLRQVDSLRDKIRELQRDQFGEVQHRRGKG